MPDPALVAIGVGAGVAALVGGLVAYERRRVAARDDELGRLAVQRGWRYQAISARGTRTERFQGSSLSGPWTLEVVEIRRRRRGPRRVIRWSDGATAAAAPAGTTPVLFLMPTGGHTRPFDLLASGGLVGALAGTLVRQHLAHVFDHVFADAALSGRQLELVTPSIPLVDYAVFCERKADVERRVRPAFAAAIARVFGDGWRARGLDRPWITVAGDRVAIASALRHAPEAAVTAAVSEAGTVLASVRD